MLKRQMLVFRFPVPVRVSDYSNQGCSLISGLGTPILLQLLIQADVLLMRNCHLEICSGR